jgi:cytochrome P450
MINFFAGMRMAKLNLKTGISLMLSKFTFELVDKKLYNEEIQFNKKQFPLMPADDILMKAVLR